MSVASASVTELELTVRGIGTREDAGWLAESSCEEAAVV
jgi:hypothetical protein